MNTTGKRIIQKILAIFVIITMTMADFAMVGANLISYAIDVAQTNNENVVFNAYFAENNTLETTTTIDAKDLKLAIELSIKNDGYLTDGKIQLQEGANFKFKKENKDSHIRKIEDNAIYLNQINDGEKIELSVGIELANSDILDQDYLSKTSALILSGNYINSKNIEKNKSIEVSGRAEVRVNWKSKEDTTANLQASLLTNSKYKVEGEDKNIVQILVKSQLNENSYPVKNTNIELSLSNLVKNVTVHKRTTSATNGDREYNYNYNEGKLTINVQNGAEGKIAWAKNSQDIFVVTMEYPEVVAQELSITEPLRKINVKSTITTYDDKLLEKEVDVITTESKEGIVSNELVQYAKEIGKGKIYAGESKQYSTTTKVHVDYAKTINNITVEEQKATYMSKDEEKPANIQFVQTLIDKAEFISIFGEEGTLNIEDQAGNTVATLSKDSETDEQGKIIVKYNGEVSSIKLTSTKPVAEGTLNIENTKSILKAEYSREELKTFNKIKDTSKVTYTKNESEKETKTVSSEVALKETESKASLKLEQSSITTTRDNQELHITTQLETNSENGDLYKNPEIKITLPKQIIGVSAQAKLLYGNGLTLSNEGFKITNENGKYVINAKLNGEQTNYQGENPEGTKLLVNAKVKLDKLALNSEEEIILNYTNENATIYADSGIQKLGVDILSENTMILTNNAEGLEATAVENSTDKEVQLETTANAKNSTIKMQIANNEGAAITDAKVIGKIAIAEGKIERTSAVTSNFELAKVYYTTVENPTADINNSANGWSTTNNDKAKYFLIIIDKLENAESINISYNISLAKNLGYNVEAESQYTISYKNSLTGAEKQAKSEKLLLTTGKIAELKLGFTAKVGGEQIKDGDEIKAGEIIEYTAKVTNTGKQTAENIVLNVTIPENTTLVEVNPNYGKATSPTTIPEENMKYFVEKSSNTITKEAATLEAGKTLSYTYMVKANKNLTEQKEIEASASVKYQDKDAITSTINNKIVPGALELELMPKTGMQSKNMISGYNYDYILYIRNNSAEEQKNVKVTINKNGLVELANVQYQLTDADDPAYTESTFTIESIPANGLAGVQIITTTKLSTENLKTAELSVTAKDSSNKEYRSNQLANPVIGVQVETGLTASNGETGYLHPGDEIKYTIDVKNVGNIDAEDLTIKDRFSSYLDLKDVTLNGTKTEYTEETEYAEGANYSDLNISTPLRVNEQAKVEISAEVDKDISTEELLKVVNKASVYNNILLGETIEKVSYIESVIAGQGEIVYTNENQNQGGSQENNNNGNNNGNSNNNNGNGNNSGNSGNSNGSSGNNGNSNGNSNNGNSTSENSTKYIISGTVWEDANQNGSRDSGEKLLEGINVYAINVSNNQTATDANGTKISATTNSEGFYTLANMPKGQYIVAFEYDTDKYISTIYQAEGVSADRNSDAVKATRKVDNVEKTQAFTDAITLTEGKANIDLGLAEAKAFDLELEKVVSKIIVTNKEGTKTYDFNDSKLAKVEIRSKYLKGSNVLIEYKIKATNRGEIAGYARNIVDYIPSSLKFSSNLNKDWYQNGNYIYNASLANTNIEPGETKELTLTLTKTITETNTGLTNNKAEIVSAYNVLGIADKDSTPGNNQKDEDDLGSADVLINPSTGATVSYVALTLTTIIVICGIAYLINKKLLTEKIKI